MKKTMLMIVLCAMTSACLAQDLPTPVPTAALKNLPSGKWSIGVGGIHYPSNQNAIGVQRVLSDRWIVGLLGEFDSDAKDNWSFGYGLNARYNVKRVDNNLLIQLLGQATFGRSLNANNGIDDSGRIYYISRGEETAYAGVAGISFEYFLPFLRCVSLDFGLSYVMKCIKTNNVHGFLDNPLTSRNDEDLIREVTENTQVTLDMWPNGVDDLHIKFYF